VQTPKILVVKGLPNTGKTTVVEALFAHLSQHALTPTDPTSAMLWVDASPNLRLTQQLGVVHPETLTLQQVVELLKRDVRTAGTWVDSLFTESPQSLTAQHDLLTVCSPANPWDAHTWDTQLAQYPWVLPNWYYGWKRLLRKQYQWIIMDNPPPALLTGLPPEDICLLWVGALHNTWNEVELALTPYLPYSTGGVGLTLNSPTGSSEGLKPFLPVQGGMLFQDTCQWLGKLPYFQDDTQWLNRFTPALLQSVQRLPWVGASLLR
jgi:hypothetical protein